MKTKIFAIILCCVIALSSAITLLSCKKKTAGTNSSSVKESISISDSQSNSISDGGQSNPIGGDKDSSSSGDNGGSSGGDKESSSSGGDNDSSKDENEGGTTETLTESVGLSYKLSNDKSYYTVNGIGECKDTDIVIPLLYEGKPVKEIAPYAFREKSAIKSITTSSNIVAIGNRAFYDCVNLSKIVISKSVYSISFSAFIDCDSLTEIKVDSQNPYFIEEDGVIYAREGVNVDGIALNEKVLAIYPAGITSKTYAVENGVTWIAPYAFYGNKNLEKVTVPDSVTRIGEKAFYGCSSLYSIKMGNSITNVGENAFTSTAYFKDALNWENGLLYIGKYLVCADQSKVKENCTVKEGTTVIADSCFENFSNILSISLPTTLKCIGELSFSGCYGLKSIVIPDSVVEIGKSAFEDCYGLKSVTISNSLKKISPYLFDSCNSLISVKIPNSVTEIGDYAFCYCNNLLSVTIGTGVKKMGVNVFDNCGKLFEICNNSTLNMNEIEMQYSNYMYYLDVSQMIITSGQSTLKEEDGFIISYNGNGAILLGYKGEQAEIVIPSSVTEIAPNAFSLNEIITSVTIGNNVKKVGDSAFYCCMALDVINTEWQFEFEGNPFYETAYYLDENNWENGLMYYGKVLISANREQTSFSVKNGTVKISEGAFSDCQAESIDLPNTVTEIGAYAFSHCEKLKSIIIPDSVETIGERAFYECESLSTVTIGSGVKSVGKDAFYVWADEPINAVNIKSIGVWCGINFANDDANPLRGRQTKLYENGEQITKLEIPKGISVIGSYAFCGFNTTRVYLPKSVYYIGKDAFRGFQGSVYYEGGVSDWCGITFENETANPLCGYSYLHFYYGSKPVFELEIPSSISTIKDYAFYHLAGATVITFEQGSNCSQIGDYAFYNIASLNAVILPSSLSYIGAHAFENCNNLQAVNFGGVSTICDYAFNGCNSLTGILLNSGISKIGINAFGGCLDMEKAYFTGTKEEWKNMEVDGSNVELLVCDTYFYSAEKPTGAGNYWHYVDGEVTHWGKVENGKIPPYENHQAETYETFFNQVFVRSGGSFSQMLYNELSTSKKYTNALKSWEYFHLVTEPSHSLEMGRIAEKDIYKLLIFDMLGGSTPVEDISNIYNSLQGETEAYMLEFLRKTTFVTATALEDLKNLNTIDYRKELSAVFSDIDLLDTIFEQFDCLYDAVFTCAQYKTFASMDEAFSTVLNKVYEDTDNPDALRDAAKESVEFYQKGIDNILSVIATETAINEAELMLKKVMDESWRWLVYSIPGGAIILEGAKGIRAIANILYNVDKKVESYYKLRANVAFEYALLRAKDALYVDYTKTFLKQEAVAYMRAVEMYKGMTLTGFDACIEMLKIEANAFGTSQKDKDECNRLIDEINAYKQVKIDNYIRMETAVKRNYEETYYSN